MVIIMTGMESSLDDMATPEPVATTDDQVETPPARSPSIPRADTTSNKNHDDWSPMMIPNHESLPGWPSRHPAAQRVMIELERFARLKRYAYPGNDELAKSTGYSPRMIKYALRMMESLGWIKAVYAGDGKRHRRGFVMLRRVTLHGRAAGTAEAVAEITEFLKNRRYGEELEADVKYSAKRKSSLSRSPEGNRLHSPEGNRLHSPEGNRLHSPEGNRLPQKYYSSGSKTKLKAAVAAGPVATADCLVTLEGPESVNSAEVQPQADNVPSDPEGREPKTRQAVSSAEALEVAEWAEAVLPGLKAFALEWCRLLPPLWVRTAIERKVVGQSQRSPFGLLAKILGDWRRDGKCEWIEKSTLANPNGKPPEPADKIRIFTNPKLNRYFADVHYSHLQQLNVDKKDPRKLYVAYHICSFVDMDTILWSVKWLRGRIDNPKGIQPHAKHEPVQPKVFAPNPEAEAWLKSEQIRRVNKSAERMATHKSDRPESSNATSRPVGT